ncbi:MAG: hypothetical protein PHT77_05440 [Bacteroidales bacterium]|nr:hypothetical protein [Bacteroidales bacterium]
MAENVARNLRCSGVTSARVVEITAYEVVVSSENNGRKLVRISAL